MGVEWDWIYQRPHVLAELLAKKHDVTVVCPKQPYHLGKEPHNKRPDKLVELIQIPFQEKSKIIGSVADFFHLRKIGDVSKYDIVWVGYPLYARYIPKNYAGKIIYDCMDNHEALFIDQTKRGISHMVRWEKELINRSDMIFTSAEKLVEKVKKVRPDANTVVVRNAYSKIDITEPNGTVKKSKYRLTYVGTVSEWFDNSVIADSLRDNDNIEYSIIGPFSKYEALSDNRIEYTGPVKHDELGKYIENADCLIMPFILNDIILYVDPVKLYEYIAWGKCIIAPYYPEIDRFGDFVYFYHDREEYSSLVSRLASEGFKAKYTKEAQQEFLQNNTWENRIELIESVLEKQK